MDDGKVVPTNPQVYIESQPEKRREALLRLRQTILQNLPVGFAEIMQYGGIGYVVPHALYAAGYHCNPKEPLPFAGLANRKHYVAVYHLGVYADRNLLEWFAEAYAALNIGRLDMGKSCIRFNNISKIPYRLMGELFAKMTVREYVQMYEGTKPKK
ncbi:MAG: DUF1801 domain-containing protein [Peptococcaceae bacterium]|nr:DUF1801 domain-containing protein [Peptococcaceae bacterium]